jgi:hypothetical protein
MEDAVQSVRARGSELQVVLIREFEWGDKYGVPGIFGIDLDATALNVPIYMWPMSVILSHSQNRAF